MNQDILEKLLQLGEKKEFKEGEIVFEEGSLSVNLCFVVKGSVGIERKIVGEDYICTLTVPEGEFCGEMALFREGKRLAQARALTDAEVVFINRVKLLDYVQENKQEGLQTFLFALESIFGRIRHTNREMSCFYQLSSVLSDVAELKDFIDAVGKIVSRSFFFEAHASYFFNAISGKFECVHQEGVEPDKLVMSLGLNIGLEEVGALEDFEIRDFASALIFPLSSPNGLAGLIVFFKKESFSTNEKMFLAAVRPQINSLLESILHKQDARDQERMKQFRYGL